MSKVDRKYADVLFKLFLSLIMSLIMSVVITLTNIGLTADFLAKWSIAFAVGLALSFPSVLIAAPISRRIVKKITG